MAKQDDTLSTGFTADELALINSKEMISESMRHYLDTEYSGISRRAPFVAHYKDTKGVWYETSFENAQSWQYWDKLEPAFQAAILERNHTANNQIRGF